jgi:hypothetical protein
METHLPTAKERQDHAIARAVEPFVLSFVRHEDAGAARRARQIARAVMAERDEARGILKHRFMVLDDAA